MCDKGASRAGTALSRVLQVHSLRLFRDDTGWPGYGSKARKLWALTRLPSTARAPSGALLADVGLVTAGGAMSNSVAAIAALAARRGWPLTAVGPPATPLDPASEPARRPPTAGSARRELLRESTSGSEGRATSGVHVPAGLLTPGSLPPTTLSSPTAAAMPTAMQATKAAAMSAAMSATMSGAFAPVGGPRAVAVALGANCTAVPVGVTAEDHARVLADETGALHVPWGGHGPLAAPGLCLLARELYAALDHRRYVCTMESLLSCVDLY